MSENYDAIVAGHICLDVIPDFGVGVQQPFEQTFRPGRLVEVGNVAFSTGGPVANTGLALDRLEIRIKECQLGLFGYSPRKKTVSPSATAAEALSDAIRARLQKGRITCEASWRLADERSIPRMEVAAACEALDIKIGCCQLGAF